MKRTPLHCRVPSGEGRIVRGGRRARAVSGMRRNPEAEIDPLPPDLWDRYPIYMQERLPWFGRPPALGSPRASDYPCLAPVLVIFTIGEGAPPYSLRRYAMRCGRGSRP